MPIRTCRLHGPTNHSADCAQQEENGAAFHWHKMFFPLKRAPSNPLTPSHPLTSSDRSWKAVILQCDNVKPRAQKVEQKERNLRMKFGESSSCRLLNTTLTNGEGWTHFEGSASAQRCTSLSTVLLQNNRSQLLFSFVHTTKQFKQI